MLAALTLALTLGSALGQDTGATSPGKYIPDFRDLLPGDYCSTRPDTQPRNCCPDRYDECSVPIRNTLCYCDEFCDRGPSGDCCPDYFSYCLGITPPTTVGSCTHRGQTLGVNQVVKENCNECRCVPPEGSSGSPKVLCEMNPCLVQPDLIEDINRGAGVYHWRASNYSQFWGKELSEGLKYLLGTRYPSDSINSMYPITKIYDPRILPREFDVRDKREWQGKIGPVVDQGWCGASWAVSTASVAGDRRAIQAVDDEKERVQLSKQNLIDCGYIRQDGCLGGGLDRAWSYLRRYGVVEEECYPYESGQTGTKGGCKTPRRLRRPVELLCTNGSAVSVTREQMLGMQPTYRIAGKETDIMHELYFSGPVQAIIRVHEDFFAYRSGVYRSTGLRSSTRTAYHSVRILGWGEEVTPQGNVIKYWIVANSWGENWGENGTFRIVRGENESDIETFVVAAWARGDRGDRRGGSTRYRRHHTKKQRHQRRA